MLFVVFMCAFKYLVSSGSKTVSVMEYAGRLANYILFLYRYVAVCRFSCSFPSGFLMYAHAKIMEFLKLYKIEYFRRKSLIFLYYFSKYRLWVHEAVLTSAHNPCYGTKIRKRYTPANPSLSGI